MKLNVGDYVRTDIGEIRKVVRVTDDLYVLDKDVVFAHKDKIKKSNPNIIDLIEVGDYVNGRIVCKNDEENYLYLIGFDADGNFYEDSIKDIKSVVTKEQFEQMEYKIN